MTRRTAQMVRSPVARRAPTARSWALTPRCGRRTVERRRPGWLRSQVADPRGSVPANDGSYVTIDRGQRPPGSASRFGQSRVYGWCLVLASVLCHPGIGGSDQHQQFVPQPVRSGRIGMHPIEHLCCQNARCPDAGLRGRGNLTFRGWSGKGHRIRRASCRTCTARFSERTGTVLEQARLPDATALDVLNPIREGCGTRATGRLVGVDKNTVMRYVARAGAHAEPLHQELVAFSPHDPGGGSTPRNRGEDGRGLKSAGPPSLPPSRVTKPCPGRSTDGPAGPILPQSRLPRTRAARARKPPRSQPQGAARPLYRL